MQLNEKLQHYLWDTHFFAYMFDDLRLVDGTGVCVCKRHGDGPMELTHETCFSYWSRENHCVNCVTLQARRDHHQHVKFEYAHGHYFFVIAHPLPLDGKEYVLECIMDVTNQFTQTAPGEGNFIMNLIRELETVSSRDPFSGLYNKKYFTSHLSGALSIAKNRQQHLYLAMFDLDRFKGINDTYGHDAGDQVLLGIASALQKGIKEDDGFAARFGGDEFAVLFKLQDREACTKKLDAIQQDIAQRTFTANDGRLFHITASYGLADVSSEQDSSCAIHQTDDRLYAQKEIAHAQRATST